MAEKIYLSTKSSIIVWQFCTGSEKKKRNRIWWHFYFANVEFRKNVTVLKWTSLLHRAPWSMNRTNHSSTIGIWREYIISIGMHAALIDHSAMCWNGESLTIDAAAYIFCNHAIDIQNPQIGVIKTHIRFHFAPPFILLVHFLIYQ